MIQGAGQVGQAAVNSEYEGWQRVHAQLLKSVADAQARLLAAQNETNDRLEGQAKEILGLNETLHRIRDKLDNFDLQFIANQNTMLSRRLDELKDICVVNGSMLHQIGTELPRRQVARPKRIVKRAVERKR